MLVIPDPVNAFVSIKVTPSGIIMLVKLLVALNELVSIVLSEAGNETAIISVLLKNALSAIAITFNPAPIVDGTVRTLPFPAKSYVPNPVIVAFPPPRSVNAKLIL
jgi:hypothetical protein